MRILVIDDDADIRRFLKERLSSDGFTVDTAGDGADGSYMARTNGYDAIVLDGIMPRKNGRTVIKEIREAGKNEPILMLSVQDEIDDKSGALDIGADDYLTKPFSYKELSSRLRALVRRPSRIVPTILRVGDLTLDPVNHRAMRGTKEIYLTRKEFALAEFLLRSEGSVVSRGMLHEHVWNSEIDSLSNTIEVHMRNLRKKIDQGARKKLILTVPGRGYRIDAQRRVMT